MPPPLAPRSPAGGRAPAATVRPSAVPGLAATARPGRRAGPPSRHRPPPRRRAGRATATAASAARRVAAPVGPGLRAAPTARRVRRRADAAPAARSPFPWAEAAPTASAVGRWLVLSKGARVLAIVFIVLGAVVLASAITSIDRAAASAPSAGLDASPGRRLRPRPAADAPPTTFASSTRQCRDGPSARIQCLRSGGGHPGHGAFQTYGDSLSQIGFPTRPGARRAAAEAAARSATHQIHGPGRSRPTSPPTADGSAAPAFARLAPCRRHDLQPT